MDAKLSCEPLIHSSFAVACLLGNAARLARHSPILITSASLAGNYIAPLLFNNAANTMWAWTGNVFVLQAHSTCGRTASFMYVPLQPELGLLQTPASAYPLRPHPGTFPRSTPALHDTFMEARAMPAPTLCPFCCCFLCCGPAALTITSLCRFCYWQVVLQTEAGLVKSPERKKWTCGLGPQKCRHLGTNNHVSNIQQVLGSITSILRNHWQHLLEFYPEEKSSPINAWLHHLCFPSKAVPNCSVIKKRLWSLWWLFQGVFQLEKKNKPVHPIESKLRQ